MCGDAYRGVMTTPRLDARDHALDLAAFVGASPSSFHAAAEAARRLRDAGASPQDETAAWDAAEGAHVAVRDGALAAWHVPATAARLAGSEELAERLEVRVVGSHTDSPGFILKPDPTTAHEGWAQAAVELYGGLLAASWFDRELAFAGRLVTEDEGRTAEHLVRTGPIARIPRLAIHLDRSAGTTEDIARQRHTAPILAALGPDEAPVDLLAELVGAAGLPAGTRVLGHDVVAADTQEPRLFGVGERLLASGRLDNLSSVHASLAAWERLAGAAGENGDAGDDRLVLRVLIANDHEEVGSATRSGAAGPFLEDVLARTLRGLGLDEEARHRVLARSSCLSCDAGHGVHPNYPEKHDPSHRPLLGRGPLTKINGNQRYATDARGEALWRRACAAAGVTPQAFVSNNDVPCGSTIGPITATRLGLTTVDVGVPLLSMHSVREMAHVDDLAGLSAAIEAYWAGA